MGYYLLSAETSFSAAHTLPGVPLCERFHGHNWSIRLTVRIQENGLDEHGMGVDFRIIEGALENATREFDHRYLNDLEPFKALYPSAENIARLVCRRVVDDLEGAHPVGVEEVEVWETPKYRVSYRPS